MDKDGKEVIPPLGYGAKAAAEGIPGAEEKAAPAPAEKSISEKTEEAAPAAAVPSSEPSTGADETASKLDALSITSADPPAVATKPGPPEGAVVFDHEPTKEEAKAAEALNGATIKA